MPPIEFPTRPPRNWESSPHCECDYCLETERLKTMIDDTPPWAAENDRSTMLLGQGWPKLPWYRRWPLVVWGWLSDRADWWCR